ncbi:MAG TPA: hypothetical protein VE978_03855 [Chitinophagales bacterium]|nr:hypothetical protein [Chitinophagales bacterium]
MRQYSLSNIYSFGKNYGERHLSLILFFITLASVVYALNMVLFRPSEFLLYHMYDQMRNYYAYLFYLHQDFSSGLFRFSGMNYPFGDYIFYTDNTPLIAFLVKIISHYIVDLTPYALPIYNWFMALSIPVSAVLIFQIVSYFSSHRFINFFASFCFAWINPQSIIINAGASNLSLSMIVLAAILLLIKIFVHSRDRKFFRYTTLLILLQVFSGFIHLYYLAVLGFCSAIFFFVWGVNELYHRRVFIKIWLTGFLQFIFSFGISFLIIYSVDGYYALRSNHAEGYGWINWKLNFSSLFTTYSFFRVKYLFQSDEPIPYASYYYLGSFFLYFITLCAVLWLLHSKYRLPWKEIFQTHPNRNVLGFLLITALVGLSVALGEYYSIAGTGITFNNMLNPLFYLHWYTPMVTQFRVLARFAYFFFWIMNFGAVILIVFAWNKFHEAAARFVVIVLFCLLASDAKNAIEFTKKFHYLTPNLYERGGVHEAVERLTQHLDAKSYQAFLPVPYFCAGSENYSLTIDAEDGFITGCMSFSLKTGLPMMASSMGRTPPEFTKEELSIFLDGHYSPDIRSKLNGKPILILYNSSYYRDTVGFGGWPPVNYEPAITAFKTGKKLIEEKPLKKIAEAGDWILFEADPKDL